MSDAAISDGGAGGRRRRVWLDALWLTALLVVVLLSACWIYGLSGPTAWSSPISYRGDALATLGFVKLYALGDFGVLGSKTAGALNAPAVAYWNDYPTTEEVVFALSGMLARLFGLYTGVNLSLLVAHLLAATSFFCVSRFLGARPAFAFVGGLAFATCHYLPRHAMHLILVHCWHLPPLVMISSWVLSKQGLPLGSRRFQGSVVVALAAGAMNPYYSAMFLQFLGLAVILAFARGEVSRARVPLYLVCFVLLGFGIASADTLGFAWSHGWNEAAVDRNLEHLERYALKPIELLIPSAHRLEALTLPGYVRVEAARPGTGAAYLGLLGVGGLVVLLGVSLRKIAIRDANGVPRAAGLVLWVFAFSIVGGINTLLGLAGFDLLRATDRYAVVLLVIALLFLVKWLSRVCPRRAVLPVAAVLAALVVWDQVLPDPAIAANADRGRRLVDSDRQFVQEIESSLGPNAMVFQLPVMPFPEGGRVHRMRDYDPLRPFLNATSLRFSFGAQKGRGWENWQRDLARLPAARMVSRLQALGFDGLLVHRSGFEDHAERLLADLKPLTGRARIESLARDLVFIRLMPASEREQVMLLPVRGFQALRHTQGRHELWSRSRSELVLHSLATTRERVCLDFGLASPRDRRVEISRGSQPFIEADLKAGVVQSFEGACLELDPGPNALQLASSADPEALLAFRLIDLRAR